MISYQTERPKLLFVGINPHPGSFVRGVPFSNNRMFWYLLSRVGKAAYNKFMAKISIKRVYEKPEKADGTRILVDRLWPRGLTKRKARLDEWLKDIGPSTELRKWFGHDPKRWGEFAKKYRAELRSKKELIDHIKQVAHKHPVTLLYGAKDILHNEAVLLQQRLNKGN